MRMRENQVEKILGTTYAGAVKAAHLAWFLKSSLFSDSCERQCKNNCETLLGKDMPSVH